MNDQIQRELQNRILSFASDITAILQEAVAGAVSEALRGSAAPARRGRPPKAQRAVVGRRGGKRIRRNPDQVKAVTSALLADVKAKPNRRMEEIAKSLRTTTKTLALPMKALIADKKIKFTGQTRARRYRAA